MKSDRFKILNSAILFSFLAVVIRLFYWQVYQGQNIRNKSLSQTLKLRKILPKMGHLLASDNFPLSLDSRYYLISLYKPNLKTGIDQLINQLDSLKPGLATASAKQIELFRQENIKWVTLPVKFNRDEIKNINLPGTSFEEQISRLYPEGNLSLGILLNLENYYKRLLAGKTGYSFTPVDATGQSILTRKNWRLGEVDGTDIKLSLNRQIQKILETSLISGLEKYQAVYANGIILESNSGRILAMASIPATESSQLRNISHLFEPGSIFKPLVVTMALNDNKIDTDFICTGCTAPRVFGQYTINNWDLKTHPNSSLKDIIKNSDNIGMSFIIEKLGLSRFQYYFHLLKLDQKTGVDLIGESISPPKKYWSDIDLATSSFGQGFAINELQMVQAFNTLANNGRLISSHLNTATKVQNIEVFSEEIVKTVKEILKYATQNSAISGLVPKNLDICAKSGTAQISSNGQYTESETVASYIGFSPCDNPKFTMLITLNRPKVSTWGSSTAAPIWFDIASQISPLL